MRNLINFLIKYSVVFLFVFLQVVSVVLIVQNRGYQRSVFLSSSNSAVSSLLQLSNSVTEFFGLGYVNKELAEENTLLKNEVSNLQAQLFSFEEAAYRTDSSSIAPDLNYEYISAKVIANSTNKVQNYITINKGAKDGIGPDMGVVNKDGVVGIIKTVSENFATVIPILNPMLQVSAKFKRTNYNGPLLWKGGDYRHASLEDIARHVEVQQGDTIVTSGLTTVFPDGVMIGVIDEYSLDDSSPYFDIRVELAVNFRTLSYVNVIHYFNYSEQKELEKTTQK